MKWLSDIGGLGVTWSVGTDDPSVVRAVEEAASRNGVKLLPYPPPRPADPQEAPMLKMTATARARFLSELEVSGNVVFACEAAGVTRAAAYDEREACPDFEVAWRAAQARARRALTARTAS